MADHTVVALSFAITSCVAEGSFRAMKGPLTPGRHFTHEDIQQVYLYAMLSGDIDKHISNWALIESLGSTLDGIVNVTRVWVVDGGFGWLVFISQ